MTADPAAESPLVSIVLPTYKRAELLGHAIRSVLSQTYSNLELIVIDDNSPDGTQGVVDSFPDPRIRYIRNSENLGLPRALNRGFASAQGQYLTWTSDDNLYDPRALATMVDVLASGDADFVFADYFQFSELDPETGVPLGAQQMHLPSVPRLEAGNSLGACFLYTRTVYERVGQYDPELFLVEDYDYWIRVASQFRIRHIAEPLYYFRRDDMTLFCSRYADVKASDVLVRYKNGLLSDEGAAQACTELVMRDIPGLHNRWLRSTYAMLRTSSFRLTKLYERFLEVYVRMRLERRVRRVLASFRDRAMTFKQARDALRDVLRDVARIEYPS